MTPADFLSQYGRAVVRTVVIQVGAPHIIPADPERIAILFWSCDATVTLQIDAAGSDAGMAIPFNNTFPQPFLTHALHGPIVNLSFRCGALGPNTSLTYATATMPNSNKRRGTANAKVNAIDSAAVGKFRARRTNGVSRKRT